MHEHERVPMVRHGELVPMAAAKTEPAACGASGHGYAYGQEATDEEPGGGLIEYWRMVRRRKGTLMLAAGLGVLLAVVITLPQTPVYQAVTTLEVLEMNQNFMNMKEVQQVTDSSWNIMLDIQTQLKVLASKTLQKRALASMKVNAAGLDGASGAGPNRVTTWRRALNLPEQEAASARDEAITMAARTLSAKATANTKIIELRAESTDSKVAAEYVNRLAQEYIDQNMESRWQMTQRTGEFLARQLDDMRVKLERSEDALQEYAKRSGLLMSSDEKTNVNDAKLKQIQDGLMSVHADRIAKQSRWEMASTAPAESLPDVLNDPNMREYMTKITDLRRQKAELAETYTPDYPKVKRVEVQIRELEKSYEREKNATLKRIRNEYDEATHKEALLDQDYRKQVGLVTDQGEKAIQYNILKREVDSNRELYEAMLQRLKESAIASAMRASNVRVVDAAMVPRRPSRPDLLANSGVGLVCGVFLGMVLVVVSEKANRTLQEPSDLAYYLGLPELGLIPSEEPARARKNRYFTRYGDRKLLTASGEGAQNRLALVTHERKPSVLAESFRATLTSILFSSGNGQRPKTLVVTSPSPGEGKTTVVTNLAIAMAETGCRVLLVDGDTRKPRLHSLFQLGNEGGLTSLLQGRNGSQMEQAAGVAQETTVPGLFVLPSGPSVVGPTNLLYSKAFPALLQRLEAEFEMIFIDTPPMLQLPDARVIGKLSSGVVLVVRANKTTRDAAIAARARLRDDGIPVLGTVMNDWNPKQSPGGYYGYYDGHYGKYYKKYYRHEDQA